MSAFDVDLHALSRCVAPEAAAQAPSTPTIIVDRCPLFREGLKQAIRETSFKIVASSAKVDDVRDIEMTSGMTPLVILSSTLDLGTDLAELNKAQLRFPESKIVLLLRGCSRPEAAILLRAGVAAILPIPDQTACLVEVLTLVMLGLHVLPLELMGNQEDPSKFETVPPPLCDEPSGFAGHGNSLSRLSCREVEIVRCLVAGEPNRSIALRLMISEATVKVHVKAILRKIKVKNRTQAAIWALNNVQATTSAAAPAMSLGTVAIGTLPPRATL